MESWTALLSVLNVQLLADLKAPQALKSSQTFFFTPNFSSFKVLISWKKLEKQALWRSSLKLIE